MKRLIAISVLMVLCVVVSSPVSRAKPAATEGCMTYISEYGQIANCGYYEPGFAAGENHTIVSNYYLDTSPTAGVTIEYWCPVNTVAQITAAPLPSIYLYRMDYDGQPIGDYIAYADANEPGTNTNSPEGCLFYNIEAVL